MGLCIVLRGWNEGESGGLVLPLKKERQENPRVGSSWVFALCPHGLSFHLPEGIIADMS